MRCGPMVHGGGCLARGDAGESLLVDGAIPGELVEVVLNHRKGGVWWARADHVLEASPHRVVPPCPYVPDCGGCDLQHVDYPHQLELKRRIVEDAMRRQRVALAAITVRGMADPWRYRWRGEFHAVPGSMGMRDAGLGFNRARSWRPIAVDDCLIHHPTITTALPALRQTVREAATKDLSVLHLTVGEDGRELLVRPKPRRALPPEDLDRAALGHGGAARWLVDSTTLHWRGLDLRVRAESFIQVNQAQADVLYSCVLEGLGDVSGLRIVDAYAGVGAMSIALAERAREVICIEENRDAAGLGVLNARLNGVSDRLRYVARSVEEALAEVAAEAAIDAVVIDPPRAGCAGSVTGWLALAGPARIAYVSCDPATMARDLHLLVASGPYRVDRFDIVDMFPQTHHVECVALLTRAQR